jgi:hypothetical protein
MQSIAPVPPPVAVDPLAAEVRTPVSEALSTGARSARDICSSVEKTLAHRQRVQKGEARPRPAVAPRVPSALQDVANELEAILASPGAVLQPGGNGKH